jgi:hypothetical protein
MHKRNRQSLPLKGKIHTVFIRSDDMPTRMPCRVGNCVSNRNIDVDIETKEQSYSTKVNPNDYAGPVTSLADFENVMSHIARDLGIRRFTISRVDFAIDCCEPGSYEQYYKINKLMILLLDMEYESRTRYQSSDLRTGEKHSTRMDSEYIQIEHYNKRIQSGGSSNVESRLELRSKRLRKTVHSVENELALWCVRLKGLPSSMDDFTDQENEDLLLIWEEEKTSKALTSKREFIMNHQDRIYSDRQLIALCESMGSTKKYAMELKRKTGIETISPRELERYLDRICSIIVDFAANDSIQTIRTIAETIAMQLSTEEEHQENAIY